MGSSSSILPSSSTACSPSTPLTHLYTTNYSHSSIMKIVSSPSDVFTAQGPAATLAEALEKEKSWIPLESNPTILNRYISNLGFDTSKNSFVDLFSTEDWALEMIPQPVCAVVVLFPVGGKVMDRRNEMHRECHEKMVKGENDSKTNDNGMESNHHGARRLWYAKQRIRNACGTFAILHAIANSPISTKETSVLPNSWLQNHLQQSSLTPTPLENAKIIENDQSIEQYHREAAKKYASIQPSDQTNDDDEDVDVHYATFVHINGYLYELDGRVKDGPIRYGKTTQRDLLKDSCAVIRDWMKADLDEVLFTILALAPNHDD